MIERTFVKQRIKEHQIQEYVAHAFKNVGHSHTKLVRTPLGEKIVIHASMPGLIVGKKGQNIKRLTQQLKKEFDLENPQIEISEVDNVYLDPHIVAEIISSSMERYGVNRFKGIGHKVMTEVMRAGALGVEILISGKLPSARAKSWRFYQGYLKKCGEISMTGVFRAYSVAQLKSGTVGIQVSIMPPTTKLPDDIILKDETTEEQHASGAATEQQTKKESEQQPAAVSGEEGKAASKKRRRKKGEEKAEQPTAQVEE
ncbi:30S ribosomal protein S3 [Candidatus Woesearchaeota archaeon]|nr:30S ribosomal protein S3 [Candidatus Woesearchaeota archaeon]